VTRLATIVRALLVPALMAPLGRSNRRAPARLPRVQRRIDIAEGHPAAG
jgi:hypothetical protein